jgi:hypothetical protein
MIRLLIWPLVGIGFVALLAIEYYDENYAKTGHADFGAFEITDYPKVWLNDAYDCGLRRSMSNLSRDELAHCVKVFTNLGHGDPYQGLITAITEFTSRP